MSTVRATNFQHPSAADPAIVLAADGTAAATVSGINGGPLAGFRNAIINGNFDIWQRGTSFGSLATNEYHADRWLIGFTGGGTRTISRQPFPIGQTDVAGNPTYYLNWNQTVAGTSQTAHDLRQKIEDVRTFAGQEITISFYAKAAAAATITFLRIMQHFGTGGSPSSAVTTTVAGTINLTTSWQRFSYSVTVPSISGKTLGSDGNDFLEVYLRLPVNTTFSIDIAQVQVEAGPVATPFERRPIGTELALCQRYCWVLTASGQNRSFGVSTAAGTTSARNPIVFPVTMRVLPSFTASADAVSMLYGGTSYASTTTALAAASSYGGHILTNVASGLTAKEAGLAQVADGKSLIFDAEL